MPLIPALRRLRQDNLSLRPACVTQFKASLYNIVRPSLWGKKSSTTNTPCETPLTWLLVVWKENSTDTSQATSSYQSYVLSSSGCAPPVSWLRLNKLLTFPFWTSISFSVETEGNDNTFPQGKVKLKWFKVKMWSSWHTALLLFYWNGYW